MKYDISIVIVNWKMKDEIEKCLFSLENDRGDNSLNIKITVVDNSQNSDNIKDVLEKKYPHVLYIDAQNNQGFGRSQNMGLFRFDAKYYFVLNPDTYFIEGQNLLSHLFEYMEKNTDIGILAPKLKNNDGTLQYSCYRFPGLFDQPFRRLGLEKWGGWFKKTIYRFLMKDYDHLTIRDVDWVMGSAMFVRDDVLLATNGFDDRFFMYYEDCDLCRRTWNLGWRVTYYPDCFLMHSHRRSSADISGLSSIIKNKMTRIHLKSWLLYFLKWKFLSGRANR